MYHDSSMFPVIPCIYILFIINIVTVYPLLGRFQCSRADLRQLHSLQNQFLKLVNSLIVFGCLAAAIDI